MAAAEPGRSGRTFQFRLRGLSRNQYGLLDKCLERHRRLYNDALRQRIVAHKQRVTHGSPHRVNYASQSRDLTAVRQAFPEWAAEDRRLAVETLRYLDRAYQAFFRRLKTRRAGEKAGFPKFRKYGEFATLSIYSGANRYLALDDGAGCVNIKGLPLLKFRAVRPLPEEQPQMIRITREGRRVVLSLVYGWQHPAPSSEPPQRPVGIDMGVANRLTLSDGTTIPGRKVDRRGERRLARAVARRKRGSVSRRKKVRALAREKRRVRLRDRGWQHETAAALVKQYDGFAIEDLKIRNMVRSAKGTADEPGKNVAQKRGLNRSIQEQSWGALADKLTYKAEALGKPVVRVNPAYTSQACSRCGSVDARSRRSQAEFCCVDCGFACNADVNAARNILRSGLLVSSDPGGTLAGAAAQGGQDEPCPVGPVAAEIFVREEGQLALPGV